jgi:hypothetical protein
MSGENAAILRQSQIGVQADGATGAEANVLLQSRSYMAVPVEPTDMRRARGKRVATAQVGMRGIGSTVTLEGYMAYNDETYTLQNLFGGGTVATPGGATNTRDWTWVLVSGGCLAPKYFSVENGIDCSGFSERWSRFVHSLLKSLTYDFDACTVSGSGFGSRLAEEGITHTDAPTAIADVPMSPDMVDVYAHGTLANLWDAGSVLDDIYKTSFEINDVRGERFPTRSTHPVAWVDTALRAFVHLEMEQGSVSNDRMTQLRTRGTKYIGIQVKGPVIEGAFSYRFRVTLAFKVNNPGRQDADDLYQGMYDLEAVHDATLGGYGKIELRNKVAALLATSGDLAAEEDPSDTDDGPIDDVPVV